MADQSAEGMLSPFLRRQRISAVRPFLQGRVLDIGCGSGALAAYVDKANYVGIDPDPVSIATARNSFPGHTFIQRLTLEGDTFDTVVALAVIEHVPDPVVFLTGLKANLLCVPSARIVCTTPHPTMDWIHWIGSRIGLFSRSANEEHEDLLNRRSLVEAGRKAGLRETNYRRFLGGANQVIAFKHDGDNRKAA
ncbi:class I SAM-dependent methyltransferase [Mesorhizobium sp. M1C.F.Ca.ET.193.01.1.1]|uniref:class I SAM-dependent methyltransferase n=2 Tax=Mesorhizobium TaxID=68287 RepID=UPI000FD25BF3|nr:MULTISPECIES: class I SAM-dependent methyltransferase [unclassified Mesorhizobium]TGS94964.1 class I SAM-dependent methyltransferase [bacterium M00.F.Ca.ET.177.01.1.1]TGQ51307.1 class I SAM-dependent methyltransferase [Mesorhizobium sp. M1C.F.Ca.ET.210.01.1.1]TGQ67094.1 class I SAM-dependent methyltransferase [Mesorhizobium sp. M1C.F.Ca.ET.212.01.1.1]TGR01590.1 class I SAM-dependent methyltransferase [Mesorhizobium sp. M1C.F.Ca.ET.204.01.1.1]TGR22153.1 class I SAM-dependent methyltransferas